MAKKVSWTPRALLDRLEILEYWANRNKSKVYSKKLYDFFASNTKLVAKNPELGGPTEFASVRVIVVTDYLIHYNIGIAEEILKNSNYKTVKLSACQH